MGKREIIVDTINDLLIDLSNSKKTVKLYLNHNNYSELRKNTEFKNYISGKRCFIIGNGPSIKRQDLSYLKDEFVITVNQSARIPQFAAMKTNIHLWSDTNFFREDLISDNSEFINIVTSVNTDENEPIVFFPLKVKKVIQQYDIDKVLNVRYFDMGYILTKNYNKNIDFTKLVPIGNTVIMYAITLAIYMGAKEIYLLGCDCTGIETYIKSHIGKNNYEYAYDISEQENKRMAKMLSIDDNETTFLGYAKIFNQYKFWNSYCKKRGIKLVNLTGGGILNEIPSESYENIIGLNAINNI